MTDTHAPTDRGLETRVMLKRVALRLFAARGVANVSVREILAAAGQRSGGALHYHFGGKEELLRELVADAARLFDETRLRRLDAFEQAGQSPTLRDVLHIIADTFSGQQGVPRGYAALFNAMQLDEYESFMQGVKGYDVGYRRCIALLRTLLPDVSRAQLNQRIRLMMLLLFSASSARERATGNGQWQRFWATSDSRETMIDCLEAMLSWRS